MAVKQLRTRIVHKYDSFENWQKSELVLLPGELGICTIGSTEETGSKQATTNPTLLFKVGDGETKAKNLKWASALAADVYEWAKASNVILENKTIKFVNGEQTVKSIPINFATPEEVKAITDPLAEKVANLEAKFDGDNSVDNQLEGLGGRLDALEHQTTGAVATAKAYTDAREVEIKKYADQAEADANTYADGKVKALADGAVATNASNISAHTSNKNNPHEVTKAQVGLGNVDNKSVATIKTEFTGAIAENNDGFVTGGAVHTAIGTINTAISTAQQAAEKKVTDLADGAVKSNTAAISAMDAAYKAADKALGERIDDVKADIDAFLLAADQGEAAIDTLKEIQAYITSDGEAAKQLADTVGQHSAELAKLDALINLEEGTTGGLTTKLANMESDISDNAAAIKTLQDITAGYSSTSTIKAAVEAAQKKANDAYSLANTTSQTLATTSSDLATLAGAVNDDKTGLVATKKIADDTKAALTELTGDSGRIKAAEGKISTLEGIVSTGADANSKLRQAITDLQTLTAENGAIYAAISSAQTAAEQKVTELANGQVNTNKSDIAAIKGDYLKAADDYIFYCGTATEINHVMPSAN